MQKPSHMTIKEWLVKCLSLNHQIPERTINAVVSHQFESLKNALDSNRRTIEVSGFGKFIFSEKRAIKRLEKYQNQVRFYTDMINEASSEDKKRNASLRLKTAIKNLEHLKIKFPNEHF